MTWTYSISESSAKDKVRGLVGDFTAHDVPAGAPPSPQLVQDEAITAALTATDGVVTYAAASICFRLAAYFATQVDRTIGATSISASHRSKMYLELAKRLMDGGPGDIIGGDGTGERAAGMFVGGSSVAQNISLYQDTSIVQPSFRVGMDDAPGTDQTSVPVRGDGGWGIP